MKNQKIKSMLTKHDCKWEDIKLCDYEKTNLIHPHANKEPNSIHYLTKDLLLLTANDVPLYILSLKTNHAMKIFAIKQLTDDYVLVLLDKYKVSYGYSNYNKIVINLKTFEISVISDFCYLDADKGVFFLTQKKDGFYFFMDNNQERVFKKIVYDAEENPYVKSLKNNVLVYNFRKNEYTLTAIDYDFNTNIIHLFNDPYQSLNVALSYLHTDLDYDELWAKDIDGKFRNIMSNNPVDHISFPTDHIFFQVKKINDRIFAYSHQSLFEIKDNKMEKISGSRDIFVSSTELFIVGENINVVDDMKIVSVNNFETFPLKFIVINGGRNKKKLLIMKKGKLVYNIDGMTVNLFKSPFNDLTAKFDNVILVKRKENPCVLVGIKNSELQIIEDYFQIQTVNCKRNIVYKKTGEIFISNLVKKNLPRSRVC